MTISEWMDKTLQDPEVRLAYEAERIKLEAEEVDMSNVTIGTVYPSCFKLPDWEEPSDDIKGTESDWLW